MTQHLDRRHFLGLAGMPRRIPDYALQFTDFNMISTVGAFGFGLSQLLFLYIVVRCISGGVKASDKSWEGAEGLEWTVPSPAPFFGFQDTCVTLCGDEGADVHSGVPLG